MQMAIEDVKWPKTLFPEEKRGEGLHLGEVIRSLMNRAGIGYGNPKSGGGFNDMQLTAEIGLLWEDVLALVMRNKYANRPGQIQSDDIWMSPDGIGPDPLGEVPLVLEEYKAAWKSTRSTPDENFSYMTQIKSYSRAVGTNVAIMRIFHVMGDYKGSGPIYRVARFVFTDRELEENWEMILKEKERMGHG